MRKLAAAWLLPVLVVAAVHAPAAPAVSARAAADDQAAESASVAPLQPAPAPHAESPGLPALAGASIPDLAASGNTSRTQSSPPHASAAATRRLARAHSRAHSARIRNTAYVHRLRAARGSHPVVSSQPPPALSI